MNKKFLIMGGIAIVFGGLSVIAADYWLKSNVQSAIETAEMDTKAQTPVVEFSSIVVAAEPMRYGAVIDPGMVKELPWPKQDLPAGAFQTIQDLVGEGNRVALAAIEPNEPILVSKITDPGSQATLSRRIEDGMRAVTIRVDDISGVAGFVVPGDRVDIALTRTFKIEKKDESGGEDYAPIELSPAGDRTYTGDPDSFVATTIVLRNVKILSIDQIADERQSDPVVVRAVTLEVDAIGAKAISAAQSAGSLSLHLRGAGDVEATEFPPPPLPPLGLDEIPTASYSEERVAPERIAPERIAPTEGFVTGLAKVTVRRKSDAATYDVRDEGAR
ncbi:Flp pilus assembly protein CpaB [Oricola cellulosilytica]|uniref:Flp pilus assembly protein CpaB n=1 Tax=Oricola cellulosilytica TaxID=1429082 RepID=A0A4R0P665_9HYPH|nr:Flp pilus assembly protein CpaB [Oricola cellulosilytica]TCD12384.1 Flp pilus assembly protein CpaB [Oricola cellulosilytica]